MRYLVFLLTALLLDVLLLHVSGASATWPTATWPTGIVDLLASGAAISTTTQANSHVLGIRARDGWATLNPSEDVYDWSYPDSLLATKGNKFFGYSIVNFTSFPQWVVDAGANTVLITNPYGDIVPMLVPNDPVFIAKWTKFLRAFMQRYDGRLAYFVPGVGQVIEAYVAKTQTEFDELAPYGGSDAWVTHCTTVFNVLLGPAGFKQTKVIFTLVDTSFFGENSSKEETLYESLCTAYPRRFGGMEAALRSTSSPGFFPNAEIRDFAHTNPCGFQFADSTEGDGALAAGATILNGTKGYIEVYLNYGDDPANAATEDSYNRILLGQTP